MQDILKRELKDYDLVVVKPTSKYSTKQLAIGIWLDNSVRFKGGKRTSYMDYFKIVNPAKEELEIKEDILKEINDEKQKALQEKQERMSKKRIPKKDFFDKWKYETKEYEDCYQNNDYYIEQFYKLVLNNLSIEKVIEDLKELADGKDIALVCYEKSSDFCHRHLVAKWINDNSDYKVNELVL